MRNRMILGWAQSASSVTSHQNSVDLNSYCHIRQALEAQCMLNKQRHEEHSPPPSHGYQKQWLLLDIEVDKWKHDLI